MEAILDGHNVVVVGAWNRRLFTPQWIKEEFAGDADVTIEVAVGNPTVPVRLSFGGLRLQVANDRIIVSGSQASDEDLGRVQDFAAGILGRLRHTPVSAVGVNFRWDEPDPSNQLLELFDLADNQSLADVGVGIQSTSIARSALWQDRVLKLSVNLTEAGAVEFHMNFHRDVTSTASAKEQVDAGLVALRNGAREVLASAYELEL